MYKSVHSFYTSSEWKSMREYIILKYQKVCQDCHKLIREDYKAHIHHFIELDMSNINNPDITLNEDNLVLLCNKCHNKRHNRFGSKTKHRYLVYGSPLSGKSTYVSECATKNDLVISMDDIRLGITGGLMHENSNNTLNDVFAVRDLLLDRVKVNATKAHNIYVVGGYPLRGERERLIRELKLEPVYIEATKEECLARLECDDTRDKQLWAKYINNWFDTYS